MCQPAIAKPVIAVTFAANLLTDPYLIFIPIPMLWKSSLKLIKKIATTIVLSAGIFVLVCATLKSVFLLVVSYRFFKLRFHMIKVQLTLPFPFRTPIMAPKLLINGAPERLSSRSSQPTFRWCSTFSEFGSPRSSAASLDHLRRQNINCPWVVSQALAVALIMPVASTAGSRAWIVTPLE